jgi:hypothetical protein
MEFLFRRSAAKPVFEAEPLASITEQSSVTRFLVLGE